VRDLPARSRLYGGLGSTVPVVADALAVGGGAVVTVGAPAVVVAGCGCAGAPPAELAPLLHLHSTPNNPNTTSARTPTTTARPMMMMSLLSSDEPPESTLRLLALD